MAKHNYVVASDEGAAKYGGEVGDEVELDIPADEAKAVVAAGWIEPVDTKKPAKASGKEASS
jgi:hypothetical protein